MSLFTNGNAQSVAIASIVGQQFTRIVESITKDLLMPLLNPLVSSGSLKEIKIAYFGGAIEVGNLIDTVIEALLAAWILFLIFKAMKLIERQPPADNNEG